MDNASSFAEDTKGESERLLDRQRAIASNKEPYVRKMVAYEDLLKETSEYLFKLYRKYDGFVNR